MLLLLLTLRFQLATVAAAAATVAAVRSSHSLPLLSHLTSSLHIAGGD